MSIDIAGFGKIAESVCGLVSSVSNNITQWKIAKLNKEKELTLAMYNILPQVIALPRDEREFFITSLYPQLLQYSNYHAFSKETKDAILSSYAQIHPDIETNNLEVNDDNFQQLYKLVDSHLAERRVEIKKLIEKCIIHIESGKTLSMKTINFIQELTDGDLAFLKQDVIPFIDMHRKSLMWRNDEQFKEYYDDLEIFPYINDLRVTSTVTFYKINRHIYELATVCDGVICRDEWKERLSGILAFD